MNITFLDLRASALPFLLLPLAAELLTLRGEPFFLMVGGWGGI